MKNLFFCLSFTLILFSCKKEQSSPHLNIINTHWYKLSPNSSDTLFSVYIPNAFTPNADGVNDAFSPRGNYILTKFCICDRSNHQIFQTTVQGNVWDGRNNNGEEITRCGTYSYQLKIRTVSGEEFENIGSVILYR